MARRGNIEELIHCDVCGEDYSPTYRRCPFCGEKPAPRPPVSPAPSDDEEDDGYVFDGQDLFDEPQETARPARAKGGKRLAERSSARKREKSQSANQGGHYDPPGPINWMRLITFILSLAIIIAALVIVFTVVYPKLHRNPNPAPSPSPSASQPASPEPSDPSGEPSDEPEPSGEPSDVPNTLNSLTFGRPNDYDFTLLPGESHTISLVFDPEGWEGEVTWTSSDENCATVDADGKVTNVNQSTSLRRVIITASAGGQSVEAVVYCRASDSSPTAPPVVTSPDPEPSTPSSGALTPGTTGVITGADGGLRVRSGPGTGYSVQASLVNGNKVTVEEDAGGGWYKISYSGSGGVTYTGYIMGEYISPTN
ncbi:MAG: SH3 domain-containing protein [Candidatus Enterenecus sp.]